METLFFVYPYHDQLMQTGQALSLARHGHFGLPYVDPADLSHIQYAYLRWWPEGGGFLTAIALLFVQDIWWASEIVQLAAIGLLFWAVRLIFTSGLFAGRPWLHLAGIILVATNPYPVVFNNFTELPSVALSLFSLALLIRARPGDKVQPVLAGILIFGAGVLRYSYMPVGFMVALTAGMLGLYVLTRGREHDSRLGLYSLGGLSTYAIYIMWVQLVRGNPPDSAAHGSTQGDGFYLDHLQYLDLPIFFRWFGNDSVLAGVLKPLAGAERLSLILIGLGAISLCLVIYLTIREGWAILNRYKGTDRYEWLVLLLFVAVSGLGSLAFIMVLSVIKPMQNDEWTFLMDARYMTPTFYLPVMLLLGYWARMPIASTARMRMVHYGAYIFLIVHILYTPVALAGRIRFYNNSLYQHGYSFSEARVQGMADFKKIIAPYQKMGPCIGYGTTIEMYAAAGLATLGVKDGGQGQLPLDSLWAKPPKKSVYVILTLNGETSHPELGFAEKRMRLFKRIGKFYGINRTPILVYAGRIPCKDCPDVLN